MMIAIRVKKDVKAGYVLAQPTLWVPSLYTVRGHSPWFLSQGHPLLILTSFKPVTTITVTTLSWSLNNKTSVTIVWIPTFSMHSMFATCIIVIFAFSDLGIFMMTYIWNIRTMVNSGTQWVYREYIKCYPPPLQNFCLREATNSIKVSLKQESMI